MWDWGTKGWRTDNEIYKVPFLSMTSFKHFSLTRLRFECLVLLKTSPTLAFFFHFYLWRQQASGQVMGRDNVVVHLLRGWISKYQGIQPRRKFYTRSQDLCLTGLGDTSRLSSGLDPWISKDPTPKKTFKTVPFHSIPLLQGIFEAFFNLIAKHTKTFTKKAIKNGNTFIYPIKP